MKWLVSVFCALSLSVSVQAAKTWKDPDTGITWSYRNLSDGTISIASEPYYNVGHGMNAGPAISTSVSGTLVIPSQIEGKKVSTLGLKAFYECSKLTQVVIPEGVTSIEEMAFGGCSKLQSVEIPESVASIGKRAFPSLKKVKFFGPPPSIAYNSEAGFANAAITYTYKYKTQWELLRIKAAVDESVFPSFSLGNWTCIGGKIDVLKAAGCEKVDVSHDYCLPGDAVTATVTPKEGYAFLGWSSNIDGVSGTDLAVTFTVPDREQILLGVTFLPKALIQTAAEEMIAEKNLVSSADMETGIHKILSDKLHSGELVSKEQAQADAALAAKGVLDEKIEEKGFVTKTQIHTLSMETPVIDVKDGKGTLSLALKKSLSLTDEAEWNAVKVASPGIDAKGNLTVEISPDTNENTAFYKFVAKPEEQPGFTNQEPSAP